MSFIKNVKQYGLPVVAVAFASSAVPAFAQESGGGADLSSLVPSYTEVGPQLVATGSAIAGVLVTFVGVRWILRMIRGG